MQIDDHKHEVYMMSAREFDQWFTELTGFTYEIIEAQAEYTDYQVARAYNKFDAEEAWFGEDEEAACIEFIKTGEPNGSYPDPHTLIHCLITLEKIPKGIYLIDLDW